MDVQAWTYIIVGITFLLYIGIAIWSKANSTNEFYIAGKGVSPLANGVATAADWMSAASFLSMAGIIAFSGYDGSVYLMGWTGGYVLLALLVAPYLRNFGILLFSHWSLIADSSRKRIISSWERCGEGKFNSKYIIKLYESYIVNYKKAKKDFKRKYGKISGWEPDRNFLILKYLSKKI